MTDLAAAAAQAAVASARSAARAGAALVAWAASFGGAGGAVNLGTATGADADIFYAGMFADGGTCSQGQWGIAGESGPERIYAGAVPLHVTPNSGAGNVTLHVTNNFAPGTNRETIDQAAVRMSEAAAAHAEVPLAMSNRKKSQAAGKRGLVAAGEMLRLGLENLP